MSDENETPKGKDERAPEKDDAIEDDMFASGKKPETDSAEPTIEFDDDNDVDDKEDEIVLGRDERIEREQTAALAAPRKAAFDEKPAARSSDDGGGLFAMLVRLAGIGFAVAALTVVAAASYVGWYLGQLSQDLPDYQALAEYAPPVTTRVYAGDGSLVAEFARERRLFVPIEQMPDHVKFAFVSAEDKTFFEHTGLDMRGVIRAQLSNVGNILRGRRLEGGSTITQQVAKNFLLSSEQRIERKVREMLIARKMEKTFTKDHILELYLNEIYLGNRSYGVAAAALNYFDKSLDDLTVAEASYLAAITKGPSNYHPIENEDRAVDRRNWVVGRLLADGRISQEQAEEARAQPLGAQIAAPLGARDWTMEYFAEEVRKQIVDLYGVEALYDGGLSVRTSVNPRLQRVAGKALRRWLNAYDQRHGWRGPIGSMDVVEDNWAEAFAEKVTELQKTRTLSEDLAPWRPALVLSVNDDAATIGFVPEKEPTEDTASEALEDEPQVTAGVEATLPLSGVSWAREYVSANEFRDEVTSVKSVLSPGDIVYVEGVTNKEGSSGFVLRQPPAINGGLIAIDPHTGRVLAMVGGFSFELSEFNRAVQAERQPGSTFKPFVYSVALDSGYTPSSTVLDAPFVAPGVDSWYKPGNYVEGSYSGPSTLRYGIEKSRNTMTARLAQDLGIGRIMDYVERFQLSDRLPRELAISLGSGETTLMRITAAYSTFVNGGKRVEPVLIDRIQDRTGKTIYKRDNRSCYTCDAKVWSGQAEPQLVDTRDQVLDARTAYQITSILEGVVVRGTGSAVRKVSEGRPLAGKTGTTNDYKDAWFVGFSPDMAAGVYVGFDMPQTLGQGEAGGKVAAPIFADFVTEALKDEAAIPFRVPSGIRLVRVNAKTGRPATPGDSNVILEAFKAGDIIGNDPTSEELFLDPLSAAPSQAVEVEGDLNGLY